MSTERQVRVFRSDGHQAIEIPDDFQLPGTTAHIRREGLRLVIETKPVAGHKTLVELFDIWEPLAPEDRLEPVEQLPIRDVNL